MRPIGTFLVRAALPEPLARLRELAFDLRWSWNRNAIALFRRVDADLWERVGHNPVLMLDTVERKRIEALASDEGFLAHLDSVARETDAYHTASSTWYRRISPNGSNPLVAYFSAEFGITECLDIFSGGLGILAGDHLKVASDLGVPLVGVGLLYQQGYFHQYLDQTGWQQELYREQDFTVLPLTREERDGEPLRVEVPHPGRSVYAHVWRAQVGRVPLYLLDTNIPDNLPEDRDITDQLYGGDLELRIRQEIVLGIGGVRALAALGLEPPVYHMNEGHSAFAAVERARRLMAAHDVPFRTACEAGAAGTIFTTHTPVPAGHDRFPPELVERYLGEYVHGFGISTSDFLALGQASPGAAESFNMTVLALRTAGVTNGVSQLHGRVSRRMWQGLWPELPEDEVPIGSITNGVHLPSWVSQDLVQVYDRYLGPRWREDPADQAIWSRADRIPPDELWRTHERRRENLVAFVRTRVRAQLARRGAAEYELRAADEVLDPEAMTIGFARRFATYKRALLLFRDPDRLARILDAADRPVQLIIAGKAHPRDDAGKALIQRIVELTREEPFRRRVVFIEDYETAVARYLVQGCDVWLNTPRPPLEASGTSGMKAAANGVLNLSTLDGWWAEAWDALGGRRGVGGWTIGNGESHLDHEEQDRLEAAALYSLLEREIVPAFYDRGADHVPLQWVKWMRQSIARLCPVYNMARVVQDYTERYYLPGADRSARLLASGAESARQITGWKEKVEREWHHVRVSEVREAPPSEVTSGDEFRVAAAVSLGQLTPDDAVVQLCVGKLDAHDHAVWADVVTMEHVGSDGEGLFVYEVSTATSTESGHHGYTVRVLPRHPEEGVALIPGHITWAGTDAAPASPRGAPREGEFPVAGRAGEAHHAESAAERALKAADAASTDYDAPAIG
jgi:glycogen phosphorylase